MSLKIMETMPPAGAETSAGLWNHSAGAALVRHAIFVSLCTALAVVFRHPLQTLLLAAFAGGHAADRYSHLFLIPLVSVYFLVTRRQEIFREPGQNWVVGIGMVAAGVVIPQLVGTWGPLLSENDALAIAAAGFVLAVLGSFLLSYGAQAFRAAAFPLGFLLLMVPIPDAVLDVVTTGLQRGTAEITYWLLKLSGTPIIKNGLVLSIPMFNVEIAGECSGIRSTMALFIAGLVASQVLLRSRWERLAIIALLFPVSIIKNGARVAVLSWLAVHVDPEFLSGNLHRDGGVVFFLLACGLVAPVVILFRWTERERAGGMALGAEESGATVLNR